MDSVTQAVLGAAVGQAVLGRSIGRRAILWGAICGTIPDLDVFVPFSDPVADFTYHRGASHSVFVLSAITPVVAYAARRLHRDTAEHARGWLLLVWMAFITHALLDCFTVYGTQVLWPFTEYPVGWSTVFIIDPAYTLPLFLGVLVALIAGSRSTLGKRANAVGLAIACLYLSWTVGAKFYIEGEVRAALAEQGLPNANVVTTPAPFNSLLWRAVAMDDDGYYEGYRSIFDRSSTVHFNRYESETHLLETLYDHWPVDRLKWFTKGFYKIARDDDAVVMSDLRMGAEPSYVFSFAVARTSNPHPQPIPAERIEPLRDWSRLDWIRRRILHEAPEPRRR